MPNKSHSNPSGRQSKSAVVSGDNQKTRSPEACARLVALGVPKEYAESFKTFPLTPHEATNRWCKKLKTPHGWKVFYFGALNDWQSALMGYRPKLKTCRKAAARAASRPPGTRVGSTSWSQSTASCTSSAAW